MKKINCFKIMGISQRGLTETEKQYIYFTFGMVLGHYNGNQEQIGLWFKSENPLLGEDLSPNFMIRIGRADKLFKIVAAATRGDFP